MKAEHEIQDLANVRKKKYRRRDQVGLRVRETLTGNYDITFKDVVAPDEEPVVPNMLHAAWRTFTHQVGVMPKVHGFSRFDSDTALVRAERHEKAIASRLDNMKFANTLPQAASWFVAHGMLPFQLIFSPGMGQAVIRPRDPLTAYPGTVWPYNPHVADMLFITSFDPHEFVLMYPDTRNYIMRQMEENDLRKVEVAEYADHVNTHVVMLLPECIHLDTLPNPSGSCPVYVARDISPDLDFHGQFDQLVPILVAQAKLMAMTQYYAEQQTAAETVVVGEIDSNQGQWAHGPGAVNVIRPSPNASASKLTNNMSPQVFQEMDRYERYMRIGGTFPAQLSGEPVASVATGRGLEKLSETVDYEVSSKQQALSGAIDGCLNAIPAFEEGYGYRDSAFAKDVSCQTEFALGASPAGSVRVMQLVSTGFLSKKTARNQIPEIENGEEEAQQVQIEQLRDALISNVMAQAAQGQADPSLSVQLIKDINNNVPVEEAYQNYVAAQQAQMQAQAGLLGGLGAPPAGGPVPGEESNFRSLLGLSVEGNPIAGVTGTVPAR